MGLIDSHAHLTFAPLREDLEGVLARAKDAGVEHVITVGTTLADSKAAVELAARYPQVSATVGVHPHEAASAGAEDIRGLQKLAFAPGVVAVGETGLDFHYEHSDRESQRRVFEAQIELARTTERPLVIHCRDAVDETVRILAARGFDHRPVVFHCFSGTAWQAETIAAHGWRISFTGIVTFSRSDALQEIARGYPGHRLMVETDSPYLSPVPVRKVRINEPAHLAHTVRFLAALRGESFDSLASRTASNTRAFFGLP
jgi:TatD DNase family protein